MDAGELDAGFDGGVIDAGALQAIETYCDGFDNDGDGRVDVSASFPIATGFGPDVYCMESAARENGAALVVNGDRQTDLLFVSDVPQVKAQLSLAAQGAGDGRITRPFDVGNGRTLLTWILGAFDGGQHGLGAAFVESDGGLTYFPSPDGGTSGEFGKRAAHPSGSLWAYPSNDGACVLLAWTNSCEGMLREGLTVDRNGNVIGSRRPLITMSPACGLEGVANFVPVADGFAQVRRELRADGGSSVVLEAFNCTFGDAGVTRHPIDSFRPDQPDLLGENLRPMASAEPDDIWVYSVDLAGQTGSTIWSLNGGPTAHELFPQSTTSSFVWTVRRGSQGVFALREEFSGGAGTQLTARNALTARVRDLSQGPSLQRWVYRSGEQVGDAGLFMAMFLADAGSGDSELRGVYYCAP